VGDSGAPTFTRSARREQIVAAAIDTIAELGYGQASLARIASRAGTSKGVVGYHFAGKDDLIRQVVARILSEGVAYMQPKILAEPSGSDVLRTYIKSNLAFMREHRNYMVAIVEIARNARDEAGGSFYGQSDVDGMAQALAEALAMLQGTGDLRTDFDPRVMAVAIRAAIDVVPSRLAREADFDVDHYAEEMANLFDLATRRPPRTAKTAAPGGGLPTGRPRT
jgi:TetR/AcrR family transcriptional regulator, fatty acid metabolism regulator protein